MDKVYQNSLWPSDAIWRQRSGLTLAQVMACCLTSPSHYLNQCWLIISEVNWHSYLGNFTRYASTVNHWNPLENYICRISFKCPRGQWFNSLWASGAIGSPLRPQLAIATCKGARNPHGHIGCFTHHKLVKSCIGAFYLEWNNVIARSKISTGIPDTQT